METTKEVEAREIEVNEVDAQEIVVHEVEVIELPVIELDRMRGRTIEVEHPSLRGCSLGGDDALRTLSFRRNARRTAQA